MRFIEPPTFDDIREALDDLYVSQPRLRLWDLSNGMNLSNNELQRLAEIGKQKLTTSSKVAIVAPSDISFGLSRMHEVYRKQEILEYLVFRTEKEALAWLQN